MNLSLNDFVTGVLAASLVLVAGISFLSRYLHMRAERRLVRMRIICRLCGNSFVSEHSEKICQCPSCGKPNLRRGNGRLG
jgi:predicted Zn-ribbon and HTH transcriptional regulator